MKSSHFGTQRKVCTKCSSEILNANTSMKKHNETCGKGASKTHKTQEKSLEVCKHWRRGKCDRGSQCNFSHVGHQDTLQCEKESTNKTFIPCRNGPSCRFLAKGRCSFGHQASGRHLAQQEEGWSHSQGRPRSNQGRRQQEETINCRFGAKCDRVPNCPYLHSLEGFPQYSKRQGFRATMRSGRSQRQ